MSILEFYYNNEQNSRLHESKAAISSKCVRHKKHNLYKLWASVFLGIGVTGFLLMCDFLKDLPTALALNLSLIPCWTAITGKGIVLWKVWGITLEGLLFFCTKKELAESWRTGCQCQSYVGAVLWACDIMGYASFAMILFFIWFILILNFIAEIISPISNNHTRARQMVEACSLIISIMIAAMTIS